MATLDQISVVYSKSLRRLFQEEETGDGEQQSSAVVDEKAVQFDQWLNDNVMNLKASATSTSSTCSDKDWLSDFMDKGFKKTEKQQRKKSLGLDFSIIEHSKNRRDSLVFILEKGDQKKEDDDGDLDHLLAETDSLFREFNPDLLKSFRFPAHSDC